MVHISPRHDTVFLSMFKEEEVEDKEGEKQDAEEQGLMRTNKLKEFFFSKQSYPGS